tara:strand:+ start:328 stop:669 length:342 start_codon:yes stop_codon:yes gene_type:complete
MTAYSAAHTELKSWGHWARLADCGSSRLNTGGSGSIAGVVGGSGRAVCESEVADRVDRQVYNNQMQLIAADVDKMPAQYKTLALWKYKHGRHLSKLDISNTIAAYLQINHKNY